jgi:hypothetical protein
MRVALVFEERLPKTRAKAASSGSKLIPVDAFTSFASRLLPILQVLNSKGSYVTILALTKRLSTVPGIAIAISFVSCEEEIGTSVNQEQKTQRKSSLKARYGWWEDVLGVSRAAVSEEVLGCSLPGC